MSSRAAPSVRAEPPQLVRHRKYGPLPHRDPPDEHFGHEPRRAVCKRCKLVMSDAEPMMKFGEFYHIARPSQTRAAACVNDGCQFDLSDKEVEPFLRKARRRTLKRRKIRP